MRAVVVIKDMQENIYFADKIRGLADEVIYLAKRPDSEELKALLAEFDIIVIGAREKVSREMLQHQRIKTKIVGTLSVGTDHLDLAALDDHGIHVERCPTANVRSVAEHAFALILALSKFLKWGDRLVAAQEGASGLPSLPMEFMGKTLGLVGYGHIGSTLGSLASSVGINVLATSPSRQTGSSGVVRFGTLDMILNESHYISISVPLTEQTRHMIDRQAINRMMSGAILVNTSREDVVIEYDIATALDSGQLSGYGGDYDREDRSDGEVDSLAERPNVILTPHIAGLTVEANDRLDNELIDRITDYLAQQHE